MSKISSIQFKYFTFWFFLLKKFDMRYNFEYYIRNNIFFKMNKCKLLINLCRYLVFIFFKDNEIIILLFY